MTERLGQLDMVFVVDNTGSMGPYIQNVKLKILEIIRTIKKEELCESLRVGLVSYRDHPPEENTFVTQKYELNPDTDRIEKNIMEMAASGGGDGPEAVADGLEIANRMEFLGASAKFVILVGDAPPHGVEPSGDNFPQGCPDGHDWEAEAKKAFDRGIVIHTVGCLPTLGNYTKGIEVYERIAEVSQGKFFPLEKAELLVKLITGIALEELDKIAIQQSILAELGVSLEDIPEDEELTDEKIVELTAKARAKGLSKRAVHHAAPTAASPESVEVAEEEIDEGDVREALRQLRRKADR